MFIAVMGSYIIHDVWVHGFGTNNGRLVSFMDSFGSCYAFRSQPVFSPIRKVDRTDSNEKRKSGVYHLGEPQKLFANHQATLRPW